MDIEVSKEKYIGGEIEWENFISTIRNCAQTTEKESDWYSEKLNKVKHAKQK